MKKLDSKERRHFLQLGLATAGLIGATRAQAVSRSLFKKSPLEHVIILERENHSYDNYFGSFRRGNGKVIGQHCEDKHLDPPHSRKAALKGACTTTRGNGHYLESDIPNYFKYAREFVLCDNYFGEILGPSVPNYFGLMAATTPVLNDPKVPPGSFDMPNITTQLTAAGVSWKNYNGGVRLVSLFKDAHESGNIVMLNQFEEDVKNGTLPAVSFLTPHMFDSEHPPHSIKRGENWVVKHVNTIMKNPVWKKSLIIIVWDEWGGFADHVTPPTGKDETGKDGMPLRYGYRVPCLVISSYAKRGYTSHSPYSHTSVRATVQRLFGLGVLSRRDAQAHDLFDCLDFNQKPRAPVILTTSA